MVKCFCDRCGVEILYPHRVCDARVLIQSDHFLYNNSLDKEYELCDKCASALKDFMEPLPQAKE